MTDSTSWVTFCQEHRILTPGSNTWKTKLLGKWWKEKNTQHSRSKGTIFLLFCDCITVCLLPLGFKKHQHILRRTRRNIHSFLNRNISRGFRVSRGDWVHLTSDLTAASGGVGFFTGKRTSSSPTRFPPSYIPVDAFPTVDHTHNSVLLGQISKDVGDRMSGVLPNTQGRPDLGERHS